MRTTLKQVGALASSLGLRIETNIGYLNIFDGRSSLFPAHGPSEAYAWLQGYRAHAMKQRDAQTPKATALYLITTVKNPREGEVLELCEAHAATWHNTAEMHQDASLVSPIAFTTEDELTGCEECGRTAEDEEPSYVFTIEVQGGIWASGRGVLFTREINGTNGSDLRAWDRIRVVEGKWTCNYFGQGEGWEPMDRYTAAEELKAWKAQAKSWEVEQRWT